MSEIRSDLPAAPKKPSIFWKIVVFIFHSLFPYFKFRKVNQLLVLAEETYIPSSMKGKDGTKDPNFPKESVFFKRQIRHNLLLCALIPAIYIGGFSFSKVVLSSNPIIGKVVDVAWKQVKARNFSEAKNKFKIANQYDKNFMPDIKLAIYSSLGSLLFAFLFGTYALKANELFNGSEQFKEVAMSLGYLNKDQEPLILYTPLGILFRLPPGQSARELVAQDRLWSTMNIQIGEYQENSQFRNIIFFKKSYNLMEGKDYGYDKF